MITINVGGEAAETIEKGTGRFIAVVVFDIEKDRLTFAFPDGLDREEGAAILRKFNCLPLENIS